MLSATTAPPRAAYPNVPRVVERTDRRTRQLADAMVRLNGDDLRGCTVRQDAAIAPEPPSDEMLVGELLALHDQLVRRLVIKARANPDFTEDRLAALWPQFRKRLTLKCAGLPLPERLEPSPSVRRD